MFLAVVASSCVLLGNMNSCEASTMLTKMSSSPATPATPNPGSTNTSTARNTIPAPNSTTSSQPEVPPRNRAQKNRAKHNPAVSPPMPTPGALNS